MTISSEWPVPRGPAEGGAAEGGAAEGGGRSGGCLAGGRRALIDRLDGAVKAIPASLDLSAGG